MISINISIELVIINLLCSILFTLYLLFILEKYICIDIVYSRKKKIYILHVILRLIYKQNKIVQANVDHPLIA